ncbi:MAG: 16S rRNA (uracil(1498)-N(3))-methyltransferase [Methylobacterium mesophilicum]|nr:16S rRNA (uracil(1498)-N(3))-methyltransferase [Methylobacterium mesophilicum]
MRANYRMQRLFVEGALSEGAEIVPDTAQTHYLLHVLRMAEGSEVLVFNGEDGEWRARLDFVSKKSVRLTATERTRVQPEPSPLLFCFAPLKVGRLDYLVQKAVEMGAGTIRPVMTQHTQGPAPRQDKMLANAVEAAEQCGVLAVPRIEDAAKLDALLDGWDASRRLIFCDEDAPGDGPLDALRRLGGGPAALLVGPEGGFSDVERQRLRALPFVTPIPLGPRILRADTAAVAALALVQATLGDWR